jgi:flavin reductase (DIM6/NTAB) family NADH-FMN oxidoreductase RutF
MVCKMYYSNQKARVIEDCTAKKSKTGSIDMIRLDYMKISSRAMAQIQGPGAFLTVQSGDLLNTMTIGWAMLGVMWGRPMMTVAVRKSRFTYSIIEKSTEFTVSVPVEGMKKELAYCGSQSGKTINKFKECKLELFPSAKTRTPILNIPGIHFECDIVFKAPMDGSFLVAEYTSLYPEKDYHTLYYGEIVECYSTEDEASSGD